MLWIIIAIVIVVIDQIAKYHVVANIQTDQMIPVIDKFFYLTLHRNSGGAWSIMEDSRTVFLIVIPIISAVVIYFMIKNKSPFLRFSLSMVLGGAIGNYIDRLLVGKVTDYLLFYIGSYAFPIFNAADMAITGGTILLAIYLLFIYKEPPKKDQNELKNEK
jgi:signal peptidase II